MTKMNPVSLQDTLNEISSKVMVAEMGNKKARDMEVAIRRYAEWLSRDPSALFASELAVDAMIRSAPLGAEALGIARRTFTNIIGRVKAAIRLTNRSSLPSFTRKAAYSPEWRPIVQELDRLVEDGKLTIFHRRGVAHLMGYANWRNIPPSDFDSTHLAELLRLHEVSGSAGRKAEDGCRAWNAIVDSGASTLFPRHRLERPSRKRVVNPDWTTYPPSLRDDLYAYVTWLRQIDSNSESSTYLPDDVNAEFGEATVSADRPKRKKAIGQKHAKLVVQVVRQTAGALFRKGVDPSSIRSLADIATVEALRTSLHDIRKRLTDEGRFEHDSGYRYSAGQILWSIARDWVGAPFHEVEQMRQDTQRVRAPHAGYMAPSRQRQLARFDDPGTLKAWYDLPATLIERAEKARRRGRITQSTIVDVQIALLMEFINVMPARPGNLCSMRIKGSREHVNLLMPRTKGGKAFMQWRPEEVKNHEHLKAELGPEALRILRLYLEHYWAAAAKFAGAADSDYLLPGLRGKRSKTGSHVNRVFKRRVRSAGLDMTMHVGRHLSAKIILDADETMIEIVSRLLGHKNLETTRRFYVGCRTEGASAKYQRIVEGKRRTLRRMKRPKWTRGGEDDQ